MMDYQIALDNNASDTPIILEYILPVTSEDIGNIIYTVLDITYQIVLENNAGDAPSFLECILLVTLEDIGNIAYTVLHITNENKARDIPIFQNTFFT